MRVCRVLGWGPEAALLCGAGKFTLRGPGSNAAVELLLAEQRAINDWLKCETRGELHLTLAWADAAESDKVAYLTAQKELQRKKVQPWAAPYTNWDRARLILDPLDTPCTLCQHAPATEEEIDPDAVKRLVCHTCASHRVLGQKLPQARWLVVRESAESAMLNLLGLGIDVVTNASANLGPGTLAVANLQEPEARPAWCPADRFMQRRLMAHVPTDEHGVPVWFTELAEQSQGDQLLAVLKADVEGEKVTPAELLPLVYDELRKLAAAKLAAEQPGQTLDATALVHEAYLRLVVSPGRESGDAHFEHRGHFFAAAAEAMRRILIDHARNRNRLKRGGGRHRVDLERLTELAAATDDDLIELDEALDRLAKDYPAAAELVKLRFFAGMSLGEAADALGLPRRTADRHWSFARAWLAQALGSE